MHRLIKPFLSRSIVTSLTNIPRQLPKCVRIGNDVKEALEATPRRALVALESTVVTHGLPAPQNFNTAIQLEEEVRKHGAVPATIGVVRGQLVVGLSLDELHFLAQQGTAGLCSKVSRRDLAAIISKGENGGTTVSCTMLGAYWAGIDVFATGGVGGVHRGGQDSLDWSADLMELGRTPIAVVCSGIKSILDIGRSLEVLETQGVPVLTLGNTSDFPAFFAPTSGFQSPHHVKTVEEAAHLIHTHHQLAMSNGIMIAVPLNKNSAIKDTSYLEHAVQQALAEAPSTGRDVTPFVLNRVAELTNGESLRANIALLRNNAQIAAKIAVRLTEMKQEYKCDHCLVNTSKRNDDYVVKRAVVIGGCNVDFTARIHSCSALHSLNSEMSHRGQLSMTSGGVAKNIADALTRLTHKVKSAPPLLLSAVARDSYAQFIMENNRHMDWSSVDKLNGQDVHTATYNAILNGAGELLFGVQDMDIHESMAASFINEHENKGTFKNASLVIVDANYPPDVIHAAVQLCRRKKIPLWYEPTDQSKAKRIFESVTDTKILCMYTSPNLHELLQMNIVLRKDAIKVNEQLTFLCAELQRNKKSALQRIAQIALNLQPYCQNILVTLGEHGVLVITEEQKAFLSVATLTPELKRNGVQSVSGAGDCFVAGVAAGLLRRLPLMEDCVPMGLRAAQMSLASMNAVPTTLNEQLLTKDAMLPWTECFLRTETIYV